MFAVESVLINERPNLLLLLSRRMEERDTWTWTMLCYSMKNGNLIKLIKTSIVVELVKRRFYYLVRSFVRYPTSKPFHYARCTPWANPMTFWEHVQCCSAIQKGWCDRWSDASMLLTCYYNIDGCRIYCLEWDSTKSLHLYTLNIRISSFCIKFGQLLCCINLLHSEY